MPAPASEKLSETFPCSALASPTPEQQEQKEERQGKGRTTEREHKTGAHLLTWAMSHESYEP